MRTTALIVFIFSLFFGTTLFAQLAEYDDLSKYLDSTDIRGIDHAGVGPGKKMQLLEQFYNSGGKGFIYGAMDDVHQDLEKFQLHHDSFTSIVDWNRDGHPDIIYDGFMWPGHEASIVIFFKQVADSFVEVFSRSGRLIDINVEKNTFILDNYPCCSDVMHYLHTYEIHGETFRNVHLSEFLSHWYDGAKQSIPPEINTVTRFKLSGEARLRWAPTTEVPWNIWPCDENKNESNVFALYPEGSTGIGLYTSPDGKWHYVRMDNNLDSKVNCKMRRKPKYHGGTYGWMQAK